MLKYIFPLIVLLASCKTSTEEEAESKKQDDSIQALLDSAKVQGSILIFDTNENLYLSNDFKWAETGFIPASTFKIANSINALENGIVEDTSSMFQWDGEPKFLKSWEEDMNFRQAYQRSCVPCYQEIARKTGVDTMKITLSKIGYPGMLFDSTSLDNFWLEGNSKISQFQQIDFLKRLYKKELSVSEKTYDVMKQIMLLSNSPEYKLYGKTGWATQKELNVGWFVGYAITANNVYFIATNIQPAEGFDMDNFGKIRMGISLEALDKTIKR